MSDAAPEVGRRSDGSVDHAACLSAASAVSDESASVVAVGSAWESQQRARPTLRGLWRQLRFLLRFRARALRPSDLVPRADARRHPDCAACSNNCCIGVNQASLRLVDVARLHDAGLGWAIVPPTTSRRLKIYPDHPELEAIEARDSFRRFPVLQQDDNGRCVFLDDDLRCAIYPIRPLACRRFPLFVDDDLTSVGWASTCRSFDAAPTAPAEALEAVVDNHNHKLRDLWLVQVAPEALAHTSLTQYLPGVSGPAPRRRFADVLDDAAGG